MYQKWKGKFESSRRMLQKQKKTKTFNFEDALKMFSGEYSHEHEEAEAPTKEKVDPEAEKGNF